MRGLHGCAALTPILEGHGRIVYCDACAPGFEEFSLRTFRSNLRRSIVEADRLELLIDAESLEVDMSDLSTHQ
jgi:hypothetical protein